MQWKIINAGRVWVDAGGPFGLVPRKLWDKNLQPDENNRVPMDLNCLLIHSQGKTILVDTGIGEKLGEKARLNWGLEWPDGTLLDNLSTQGVNPEDVDVVINTHLHSDHCGGNTQFDDGDLVPSFPRAEYWVQYMEWADAMHPNARTRASYLPENFQPLWEQSRLRLLYGDAQVTEDVRCIPTPGDTRGHQSVIIDIDENPVMFTADMAADAIHMARNGWVSAYDVEPLENIATKKIWQQWALENNATLIFQHDTKIPAGRLVKDEAGRLEVLPID